MFRCYVSKNVCFMDHCDDDSTCPGDAECVDKQCQGEKCRSMSDCDPEKVCVNDQCIFKPTQTPKVLKSWRTSLLNGGLNRERKKCEENEDCDAKSLCVSVPDMGK